MKFFLTTAVYVSSASMVFANCVTDEMAKVEASLPAQEVITSSGSLDIGGCSKPDGFDVTSCGEKLKHTKTIAIVAPDGTSLEKDSVKVERTASASQRYELGKVTFETGTNGNIHKAMVVITCEREDKVGGGGCEISAALAGLAVPFLGNDKLRSVIETCGKEN